MAFAHRLPALSACISASVLTACASFSSSGPPAPPTAWIAKLEALELAPDREVESIPAFRINSFRVLDATHVLIHSGVQRSHVVTVGGTCSGLGSAQRLGYTVSGGALTRLDKLILIGPQGDAPCPIESIQALKSQPLPR
jgi:Family of unknown function (DUF6491)